MFLKKTILASSLIMAFSLANAASIPQSTTEFDSDQTFDSISGDLHGYTYSSKDSSSSMTFDVKDPLKGSAVISATQGTNTFKNFNSFTIKAESEEQNNALFTMADATLNFDNIKEINLGTPDSVLKNIIAVHAHSGSINFTNFDTLNINARWGVWAQNQSNGTQVIIDGGNTGVVNINAESNALGFGLDTNYSGKKVTVGINAKQINLSSQTNEVIEATNIAGVDTRLRLSADQDINITGQAGGVAITGQASENSFAKFTSNAGNINISGGDGDSINLQDGNSLELGAGKAINVSGDIEATNGTLKLIRETNSVNFIGDTKGSVGTLELADNSVTTFSFDSLGSEEEKVLNVGTVSGNADINVNYTAAVADELAAGADKANLFNGLELGDYELDQVHVSNDGSAWGSDAIYYKDGTVQVLQGNTLLSSATDLAITNALMWRSQLTNLTDRMGTLRTMPESAGAWARYNGGRLDGRGIEHDYNTIEVGFDKAINNNVTIGISFDYTKGDTDLEAGTSDNNTYTLGLYGSYFNESGCFLDAMLKVGRIDTDYDLNNGISEKGDYMLTGTIVGIETGHRWNIQNYFIEPQVQLTYSYLRPENYNTNLREVKFDDMKSLIARVGIMGGMKFAEDRGSAYVKASYNHDFLGDIEGNYSGVTTAGNAVRVNIDDELDDNWGEVSLGASYQVTDSVNTFVDVGTGFGGDIDQKWRVNLGARYVF